MNLDATALTWGQILWLLSPELLLLAAALVILTLDLTLRTHPRAWRTSVALVGLGAALVAVLTLWRFQTLGTVLTVLSYDPLALIAKMLGMLAVGLVVLLSSNYVDERTPAPGLYCALLLIAALTLSLLASATDLIMIILAFDFFSIIAYILTGYLRDDGRSSEAAIKYFLYGAVLSAVMLFGFSWIYGATGTTSLEGISAFIHYGITPSALRLQTAELLYIIHPTLIMVLAGFAFKVAAAPFHQWAPDAYQGAPTPVAAFLATVPKIGGFIVLARFTLVVLPASQSSYGVDWQVLLLTLSVVSMFVGNLVALWQTNIKRLLAYSSISQAGYILIGILTQTPRGIAAVLFYLLSYLLTNLGVFGAVLVVTRESRTDEIGEFAGLHKRAPWLAFAVLVGLLSLVGIPLTSGFIGKLGLFTAALESGFPGIAILAVINSVISMAYYWKVARAMYFPPPWEEKPLATPRLLTAVIAITTVGVLLLGVYPDLVAPAIRAAVQSFFEMGLGRVP